MSEPTGELTEVFIPMVERCAANWHGGRIPESREARIEFISRILNWYMPDSDREITKIFSIVEWGQYRERCAGLLAEATDIVGRFQSAKWKN
jgi:hypothetical protein